ncbi:MAG: hypothetical protein AAF512_22885 [Pseudomonadota bacterium]
MNPRPNKSSRLEDWLVVDVLSDETASSYKQLPITNLEGRVNVVRPCHYVDKVIPAAPDIVTAQFLAQNNISLIVHGNDASDETIKAVYGDVKLLVSYD